MLHSGINVLPQFGKDDITSLLKGRNNKNSSLLQLDQSSPIMSEILTDEADVNLEKNMRNLDGTVENPESPSAEVIMKRQKGM